MGCKSASVQRVADKTDKARQQLEKLEKMITDQSEGHKKKFFDQIDAHLKSAQITDASETEYNSNIKTEYTSEFSLDKIAKVVTGALEALKQVTNSTPGLAHPATSPAAINAYVDVVNTVAEAAKSSSKSAASLAFSMTRLGPGIIAFLYATSTNIQDNETFGSEAVTTTGIFYRLMMSIDDLKKHGNFETVRFELDCNLQSYQKLKTLQVGLIDRLASGELGFKEYEKLDALYEKRVKELEDILKSKAPSNAPRGRSAFGPSKFPELPEGPTSEEEIALVNASIATLTMKAEAYKVAIEKAQRRIKERYFEA